METHFNISKNDIFDAEVVFFRNSYLQSNEKGNFSYVLWYSEHPTRIVLAKSKIQARTTDLQYITSYRSIEEYYRKDLSYHKEHIDYLKDGLFYEIKQFFSKYGKKELLEEIEKDRNKKENSSEVDKNLKKMVAANKPKEEELEIKISETTEEILFEAETSSYSLEELPLLLKNRILILKENRSMLKFPKESLMEVQKIINLKKEFNNEELNSFAKNMIKTFWMLNDPEEKEIEVMIDKIL